MDNIISEMKNTLEGINIRINESEKQKKSELEDRLVEIIAVEQNKGKGMKRNQDGLRHLWDNIICTNIHGGPRRRRERRGKKKQFEEIKAENFPNMGNEIFTQVQEAHRDSYRISPRRNMPRHILIKLKKIKD